MKEKAAQGHSLSAVPLAREALYAADFGLGFWRDVCALNWFAQ